MIRKTLAVAILSAPRRFLAAPAAQAQGLLDLGRVAFSAFLPNRRKPIDYREARARWWCLPARICARRGRAPGEGAAPTGRRTPTRSPAGRRPSRRAGRMMVDTITGREVAPVRRIP